jgi:DNA-binding transcriptional LysR family regulator
MRFQVAISDVTTLQRQLRDRELDLAVARWMPAASADEFLAESLFKDRLVVVGGATHPLAAKRSRIPLRALMGEQWVLPPPDSFFGRLVVQAFQAKNLNPPNATVTSISVQLRSALLESGRFLTIHPKSLLQHPSNRLKPLQVDLDDVAGPIACITLRNRPLAGAAKLFATETRKFAKAIAPSVK